LRDALELERFLGQLLADESRRRALGANALKVVHDNLGAIDRTVDLVVKHWREGKCTAGSGCQ